MLYLKSFTFNPFQQNTYVVYDDKGRALFFDAGSSSQPEHDELAAFIREKDLKPERLLLTHAHIDHILGCRFIFDTYGLLPEVHESELYFIERMEATAGMYGVAFEQAPRPVSYLKEGDVVTLGDYEFSCMHAPGHSPGSICFFNAANSLIIAGDVLFNGSIGRTDLPLGNHGQLIRSITEKLLLLPQKTKVYCGHGPSTTIGHEKKNNPFLAEVE